MRCEHCKVRREHEHRRILSAQIALNLVSLCVRKDSYLLLLSLSSLPPFLPPSLSPSLPPSLPPPSPPSPPHIRGVSMYRTHDLVDQVQKGIPEKYRVEVWMIYSGMYYTMGEIELFHIHSIYCLLIRTHR